MPTDEVRAFDELAPSAVQDWILPLREEHYAPQEAYLDHLAKLVDAIGRAGDSVVVGRGAGFLLPRETTLSVRIVAPLQARADRLAERMGVSVRTARRAARDLDRRRIHFERTMYRIDSTDPHNYDLVLDSNSLGIAIAAEILIRAIEAGLPRTQPGIDDRPADPSGLIYPRRGDEGPESRPVNFGWLGQKCPRRHQPRKTGAFCPSFTSGALCAGILAAWVRYARSDRATIARP